MAFMILDLSQVVQAFNMRSEHLLFKIGIASNHNLNGAALASILFVAQVLFKSVRTAFGLVKLIRRALSYGTWACLIPML